MPKARPATTGYARLAQAEESSDESDNELSHSRLSLPPAAPRQYASITQPRPHGAMYTDGVTTPSFNRKGRNPRRQRSNSSGVDIKAINARLERWADEIASKFKIGRSRGRLEEGERLEIHHSVFQAPDGVRPVTAESLLECERGYMTREEFERIVESVRVAIEQGMHPKMISQGSSGSYFARNSEGKTVGVFKPKDEEPYAAGNPKWNKWIHRNLFPCFFGRACLIPNLSYVSEAAAYTLDCRLKTHLVPYTDIVELSSKSFHYDYFDRRKFYRKKKPLPPKVGSFQVFLQGFKDANIFLRQHPWPDQSHSGFRPDEHKKKRHRWSETCRPGRDQSEDDESSDPGSSSAIPEDPSRRRFAWTESLQQSFREELEKLVILDYIMRNTDRGLDNWMIKVDWDTEEVSIVSEPMQLRNPSQDYDEDHEPAPRPVHSEQASGPQSAPYRLQKPMDMRSRSGSPANTPQPTMSIGAIDNSLSWPWKHPDAWRSFPFGWLFLPVSLIGQPFSQKTRDHFLPLLTSTAWWSETQLALRRVFSQDADFQEKMFARQIAVMKGQAWNVVETLKTPDHGPLELTRRARVCVWDDLVDIPIAVPMRVSSFETRQKHQQAHGKLDEEEMDISAANASAPQADLLGLASPPADLPNPNRFELSTSGTPRASHDASEAQSPIGSPVSLMNGSFPEDVFWKNGRMNNARTSRPEHSQRRSYNGPARASQYNPRLQHTRRFSLTSRRSSAVRMMYDGDDLEGDLGYAAAADMEGNQRKVIVERLETVKSKNPVFTWC